MYIYKYLEEMPEISRTPIISLIEEIIDLHYIHFLNEMALSQFKTYCKVSTNEQDLKDLFNKLKFYCSLLIKNKGSLKVDYFYSKETPDGLTSRLYAKNSIQSLPSSIRGFLFKKTTDLDFKNCQFTILKYYCVEFEISTPRLDEYILNREEILKSMGDNRDEMKVKFINCLTTKWESRTIKDKFYNSFDREIKRIQKILINRPEFQAIINAMPEEKKKKNFEGSFMSRILSIKENEILNVVIHYVQSKNIKICCLMFDGMLLYGDYYQNGELLDEIETEINKHFEGLNMKLTYKQHSELIKMPENFKPNLKYETEKELNGFYQPNIKKNVKIITEDCRYVSMNDTKYENDIFTPEKMIILNSAMGTGKTVACKKLFDKFYTNKRCLFLSSRIAFSVFVSKEFNAVSYIKTENYDYHTPDKFVISVESLHKLNIHKPYDVIFIDEIEASLSIFGCKTLRGKELQTYNLLVEFIQKSEKIILTGAFLTRKTYDFADALNIPYSIIHNTTKPQPRECIELTENNFNNKIFESIKQGEKNYLVFSTKNELLNFQALFKGASTQNEALQRAYDNFKFYYKGTEDTDIMKLENINEEWGECSGIATTTIITVGNSYKPEIPDFHNVFMYCAPWCLVCDIFQSHMRVRELINNKVYYTFTSDQSMLLARVSNKKKFKFYKQYQDDTNFNKKIAFDLLNEIITSETKKTYDNGNMLNHLNTVKDFMINYEVTPRGLQLVVFNNLLENTLNRQYYKETVNYFLELMNYKNSINTQRIETLGTVKIELLGNTPYYNIPNITDFEAETITRNIQKKQSTQAEKLQLEKYYFDKYINPYFSVEYKSLLFASYLDKNCNTFKYLCNSQIETYDKIHFDNLNMKKGAEFMEIKTLQHIYIKKFNNELGISNSLIENQNITRESVENLNIYLFENRKNIHKIFDLQDRAKNPIADLKNSISILNKVYNEWTGTKFKPVKGAGNVIKHYITECDILLSTKEIEDLPYYREPPDNISECDTDDDEYNEETEPEEIEPEEIEPEATDDSDEIKDFIKNDIIDCIILNMFDIVDKRRNEEIKKVQQTPPPLKIKYRSGNFKTFDNV